MAQAIRHRGDHVGFVVGKEVLGQVLSMSSSVFPCQYHSTMALYLYSQLENKNRPVGSRSSETFSLHRHEQQEVVNHVSVK
jgi:hypothetical protein